MRFRTLTLILMTPLFLTACGPGAASDDGDTAEDGMPEMPGRGMDGMDGMGAMQADGDMMARMGAHMRMMEGMSGDSIQAMLPMHRQMVANMIASMNREMREMNMPGDAAWRAAVDSLRSDLVAMPQMDAAELEALMPAHHRRAMRLMEMHGEMMEGMAM
ncbi:MAG: hypothetical protein KY466_14495 [Gemmatimonadetes bacterium]|nr:hypothetical protein [Gemmatimonadota bacterium]